MSFEVFDDRQKAPMEYNYNLALLSTNLHADFQKDWQYGLTADNLVTAMYFKKSYAAGWMCSHGAQPKRVGILASRSSDACIGILGAAWTGAAYFPINLSLPEAGVIAILNRSGLDALVADETGSRMLSANLLNACPSKVLARRAHIPSPAGSRIIDFDELPAPERFTEPALVEKYASGYVIHTSGSTGIPKGVVYPAGAVDHLWRALDENYPLSEEDRAAETSATSFDISVYNMFSTWRAGASLHIIPSNQVMAPAKFIQKHQLTVWYSVPSIASFMARLGLLPVF